MTYADPREQLCALAALAYDRRLLDSAGGNFSIRNGDVVFATPRYAGSRRQWRLTPEEIVDLDLDGRKQAGTGEPSREIRMHLAIYRAFPLAGAVFHAHPLHVMVFASLRRPIPPTSEQTRKFGVIGLAREAPAHSPELAASVVEALAPAADGLAEHAMACLLPEHGIVVVGRNADDAYDALERIDASAYILIAQAALKAAG
ncbi:MAG: class II aldolase/adducin family protein [Chthonomonadales bacterium]